MDFWKPGHPAPFVHAHFGISCIVSREYYPDKKAAIKAHSLCYLQVDKIFSADQKIPLEKGLLPAQKATRKIQQNKKQSCDFLRPWLKLVKPRSPQQSPLSDSP